MARPEMTNANEMPPQYMLQSSRWLDPRFTWATDDERRGVVRNGEIRVYGEVLRFDGNAPPGGTHVQVDQWARFADRRPGLHLVHSV